MTSVDDKLSETYLCQISIRKEFQIWLKASLRYNLPIFIGDEFSAESDVVSLDTSQRQSSRERKGVLTREVF